MQAIVTKYLAPTNTRCARIKATACGGESVTVSYHDDSTDPHGLAVKALLAKTGWTGDMVSGGLNRAGDICWVFVESGVLTNPNGKGRP